MKQCYVCLYLSYLDAFEYLTDAQVGKLARGMLMFAREGKEPELKGPLQGLWAQLRFHVLHDRERYLKRCEASRENGKKGGRPPKRDNSSAAQVSSGYPDFDPRKLAIERLMNSEYG